MRTTKAETAYKLNAKTLMIIYTIVNGDLVSNTKLKKEWDF